MPRLYPLFIFAACACAFAEFPTIGERGFCIEASAAGASAENFDTAHVEQLRVGDPEGARFSGGENSALTLYFSNALGFAAKGPFDFRVETYRQIPFEPSAYDAEIEPSRSELSISLECGAFGVWRVPPRATSDFFIKTPFAELRIESDAFAIWVDGDRLAICLKNGIAYLSVPQTGFTETVQTGQYVVLRKSALEKSFPLEITQATVVEKTRADALLAPARWPHARIHFFKEAGGAVFPRVLIDKTRFLQRPVGDLSM